VSVPGRPGAARGSGECVGDACLTCGDVALPARVRSLLPAGLALVETEDGAEEVSVALVDARPGDVVLVHAKEALTVVARAS
jgi:hydrogenase maturation factor